LIAAVSMLESAAVAVLGVLFISLLGERLERAPLTRSGLIGLVFGIVGIITMLSPVELAAGFRIDARNVAVALSTAAGGPFASAITAIILSAMRIYFGGAGMLGGIVSILLVSFLTSVLWIVALSRGERLTLRMLALLAAVPAAVPAITVHFFAAGQNPTLVFFVFSFLIPTNFLGTFILGSLLIRERQRRWALAALRDEKVRLQTIANHAPGILFQLCLGDNGLARFNYVSEGSERYLGLSPAEILERPNALAGLLSRETTERVSRVLEQSKNTREPLTMEVEVTRADGDQIWMRAGAEPREDSSGQLVWDGTLFDITEEKRNSRIKDDFISTVSHELRTPLTSIRGALGLMSSGASGEVGPKMSNLIKIAHKNSERLVALVNDILDIERITTGRLPFTFGLHDLGEMVHAGVDASRNYMPEKNVMLVVEDNFHGEKILTDPERFHQVLMNLLSNAIKFSPDSGQVRIAIGRRQDEIVVSVSDNGLGIPESFHERIFGKFERADNALSKSVNGTGLGLSIAKAIVERLNGRIWFETSGAGSVFHVALPAKHKAENPAESDEDAVLPPEREKRILVVEDDRDIANYIVHQFLAEGYICDVAPSSEVARRFLSGRNYMAMTLDLRLADGSGIEFLREARAKDHGFVTPVIVISAYIDDALNSVNGSALGIIDWIEKGGDDFGRLRKILDPLRSESVSRLPRILHIEDEADIREIVAASLGDVDLVAAQTFEVAVRKLASETFDVVILDLNLPDGAGRDLLDHIPPTTAVVIFSAWPVDQSLFQQVDAVYGKSDAKLPELGKFVRRLAKSA